MGKNLQFNRSGNSSSEGQYSQWWESLQDTIRDIVDVLHDSSQPAEKVATTIWEHQAQIHKIFSQGLDFANMRYAYFEEKRSEMYKAAKEYTYVDLKGKDVEFLKQFRKEISATIDKYENYLGELYEFTDEFSKPFAQFCKRAEKESYMEAKTNEIRKLKTYCSEAEQWMEYLIEALSTIRRKAFRMMKKQ